MEFRSEKNTFSFFESLGAQAKSESVVKLKQLL
jgi:hypothetical protein